MSSNLILAVKTAVATMDRIGWGDGLLARNILMAAIAESEQQPGGQTTIATRKHRDWIVGECGTVELISNRTLNVDAALPEIGTWVECLFFDGSVKVGRRVEGFQPGCGWIWQTDTGWCIAGHPLLICWRPIVD